MSLTRDQLLSEILKLSPDDREQLAEEVLLSISPTEQAEIDVTWLAEARRRDAEFKAGRTTSKPVSAVIARLAAKGRA